MEFIMFTMTSPQSPWSVKGRNKHIFETLSEVLAVGEFDTNRGRRDFNFKLLIDIAL